MADTPLTITANNVLQSTNAFAETGLFGETVTAGQSVYKDSTTGKFFKAECDVVAHSTVYGIALNGGAVNQPAVVQTRGNITIGATTVVGTVYGLSATAGGICDLSTIVSTNYVSMIGIGVSVTDIQLAILNTGLQKA